VCAEALPEEAIDISCHVLDLGKDKWGGVQLVGPDVEIDSKN
jgi:hypothetical protein